MKTFNISKFLSLILICSTISIFSCKKAAVDEDVKPALVDTDTDSEPVTVLKATTAPVIRVIAGSSGPGYQDGKAKDSKFGAVEGLWVNKDGSLYVCDFGNDAIRKIVGDSIVSTLNIPSNPDSYYEFGSPRLIAVLDDGTFCVVGYEAMHYFKIGGSIRSTGISWREMIEAIDTDPDGKRFWLNINGALYYRNAVQQFSTFAFDFTDFGPGSIASLATCPNGVKYIGSYQRLYKYTSKGVGARILPNLQIGYVTSIAVSRDGYKIYIVDDGTLKVITNDPSKPKTITTLASIGNSKIALSNSEKYIYFTNFVDNTVSKLTL